MISLGGQHTTKESKQTLHISRRRLVLSVFLLEEIFKLLVKHWTQPLYVPILPFTPSSARSSNCLSFQQNKTITETNDATIVLVQRGMNVQEHRPMIVLTREKKNTTTTTTWKNVASVASAAYKQCKDKSSYGDSPGITQTQAFDSAGFSLVWRWSIC